MIDIFLGETFFLSNFYMAEVTYDGVIYPSTEHAYQAAKTLDHYERYHVVWIPSEHGRAPRQTTAGQAKRAGKKVTLRADWEHIKYNVMLELVRQKFTTYPDLKAKLIATHPHQLVEGNNWGDRIWGKVNGVGQNLLGEILMTVRNELMFNT